MNKHLSRKECEWIRKETVVSEAHQSEAGEKRIDRKNGEGAKTKDKNEIKTSPHHQSHLCQLSHVAVGLPIVQRNRGVIVKCGVQVRL